MMVQSKFQFFITYRNGVKASAASKPVIDTSKTLHKLGYQDYSLTFDNDTKNLKFYFAVLFSFTKFFFQIKNNSIVATQFPITTVNYLFIYFIKLAHFRGIKFITIIHDINALREQAAQEDIQKELRILSAYDGIVVHNSIMEKWLIENGLRKKVKTVPLIFFDYITPPEKLYTAPNSYLVNEIAFAGHLAKSQFVYTLNNIKNWKFNIYGGDFDSQKNRNINTIWKGEFSPDEVVHKLEGSFGLVWDGSEASDLQKCRFGNYMYYNNPFKFSLYLAAGLPVIAPKNAAIAKTIEKYDIGFLINSLSDLDEIVITESEYAAMKKNVKAIQKDIIAGNFLHKAVTRLEELIEG